MRDKQPWHSPEAWLPAPRLADWGPTPETPVGQPHLKPRVGAHQEQRLAAQRTGPRWQTSQPATQAQSCRQANPTQLRPRAADQPAKHDSGPKQQIG